MMRAAIIFLTAAVVAVLLFKFIVTSREFQFFGDMVSRVNTQQKIVALTFDDGPEPERTEEIIAVLNRLGVKSTFFLNGDRIEKFPNEAKRIMEAGHELGNHGYQHKRMILISPSEAQKQVRKTTTLLNGIGYRKNAHFRPPYGNKFIILPKFLADQGITTIMWDIEPETENGGHSTAQQRADYVVTNTKPGSIVLLHVMGPDRRSIRALPDIVNRLSAQGYSFVTIDQMLRTRSE